MHVPIYTCHYRLTAQGESHPSGKATPSLPGPSRAHSSSSGDTSSSLCEGYSRTKPTAVAAANGWGGDDDGGVGGACSAGAGADADATGRDGGGVFAAESFSTHPEREYSAPPIVTAAAGGARDEERSGEGLGSALNEGAQKETAEGQGEGGNMLHGASEVSPDVVSGDGAAGPHRPRSLCNSVAASYAW